MSIRIEYVIDGLDVRGDRAGALAECGMAGVLILRIGAMMRIVNRGIEAASA